MLKMNVQEILIQTMYELLSVRSIDKIQLQDILNHSGVSRTSFYRLFRDKYDLRNACYKANIDPILEIVDDEGWKSVLERQFDFFHKSKRFLLNGISEYSEDSINGFILFYAKNFYSNQIQLKAYQPALARRNEDLAFFYASGCVQVLFNWLTRGAKETPAEMAQELYDFMPEELKQILK